MQYNIVIQYVTLQIDDFFIEPHNHKTTNTISEIGGKKGYIYIIYQSLYRVYLMCFWFHGSVDTCYIT